MSAELSIYDPMPFGMYVGELIGTVIEADAAYMEWVANNTDLKLDEKALAYIKECK